MLRTIGLFLFGDARSILELSRSRAALWTSIVLVLLTGVARNYDQSYIFETPLWLIGPLAFSLVSGSFLYSVVVVRFGNRHSQTPPCNSQWPSFMTVFWMTAPIAWLYAIPVERFLNSYAAAQANITLLGVVSVWRVLLMSRIMAVLLGVPFLRAFAWVLLGASLEVILVGFLGVSLSEGIIAAMSGMRNSPEEDLLKSALGFSWIGAWGVLVVVLIYLSLFRYFGSTRPLPEQRPSKVPGLSLTALAALWILIAIPSQLEQRRFVTHARLMDKARYDEAVNFLSDYRPEDFPPSRWLEPNPYEYRVWNDLPPTIARLRPETPQWIRDLYLSHLRTTHTHGRSGYHSLPEVAEMFSAVEKLPEGRQWLMRNQEGIARQGLGQKHYSSEKPAVQTARSNIMNSLRNMGMTETNLHRLWE